jgi:hypothetical protein
VVCVGDSLQVVSVNKCTSSALAVFRSKRREKQATNRRTHPGVKTQQSPQLTPTRSSCIIHQSPCQRHQSRFSQKSPRCLRQKAPPAPNRAATPAEYAERQASSDILVSTSHLRVCHRNVTRTRTRTATARHVSVSVYSVSASVQSVPSGFAYVIFIFFGLY